MLSRLKDLYWRFIASPEAYARHLGVTIGKNCLISTRNWSTEPYLVSIGDHVQVTQGVTIHTHGGAHIARRQYPNFDVFGKVRIENWAYIGAGTQVMPGVTIGEGALITAGSIVCKSVPANELWGGVPARRICSVDDYIAKNLKYNLDSKGLSASEKKKLLLSLPDNKFINK